MLAWVVRNLSSEAFDWEPALLTEEIEKRTGKAVTAMNRDKLQAAIVVLTTDLYEHDWHTFSVINSLFACKHTDPEDLQEPDAVTLAVGLAEARLIKHEPLDFHPDVLAYAGCVFLDWGLTTPPAFMPKAIMSKAGEFAEDAEKRNELEHVYELTQ